MRKDTTDEMEKKETPSVKPEQAGMRVDKFLAETLGLSRMRVLALIKDGRLASSEKPVPDPSYKIKAGETFALTIPPPVEATHLLAQDIPLRIVYEDDDLIVLDKPAGLTVHPGAGNPDRTLVNALLSHCKGGLSGIGGVLRPGIVHRLDKDTSGLLVVAKNDRAHIALTNAFAAQEVEKKYLGLVWGSSVHMKGTIDTLVGRSSHNRQKMAVLKRGGKQAVTLYDIKETYLGGKAALVEYTLKTGRTHQIRVQSAHVSLPLIGDPLYGKPVPAAVRKILSPENLQTVLDFKRQALHAARLSFVHPVSGKRLSFKSDPPEDMQALQDVLNKA